MTVLLAEHRLERVAGFVDLAAGFDRGRVRGGAPTAVLRELGTGPPVSRLGAIAGWEPIPLTVRDARRFASATAMPPPPARTGNGRGEVLARIRGVRTAYGPTEVLRGVDLDVRDAEVLAVMGRNGAGKSTLLRVLAGVHAPSRGEVHVRGREPRPGIDVALCPQEADDLLFNETVEGEVRATLKARGETGDAGRWLGALGIAGLAPRHPRDLSAGQRLLVAVASVAATEAPLLLLDEPTRGLDQPSKERLVDFVRGHARAGTAVVLATHDVELAAAVATRVVMLAGGEVIADGDPGTVLGDSRVFAPQMTRVFGAGWLTPEQVAGAIA
jgi:energy-coupling factor transport system ATP-binding protein